MQTTPIEAILPILSRIEKPSNSQQLCSVQLFSLILVLRLSDSLHLLSQGRIEEPFGVAAVAHQVI